MNLIGDCELDRLGSLSQAALDRFIYIIGSARGGTSVLLDAIGIHDQILALPGMTHFMNQVWRYRKKVHMRLLRQIHRLPGFYHEREVIQELDQERGRLLQRCIDQALSSHDLKLMWQIYPLVYALDNENRKDRSRILCWADKANDFYEVYRVATAFPKGRFILILRDPRGSVSSLAKRTAVKEEGTFAAPIRDDKIIEASISWRRMTQRQLRFSRHFSERCFELRFEDFVMAPTAVLNSIFRFIGLESLSEDVLEKRLGELAYGSSNNPETVGAGVQKEPMERWKKNLTDSQRGIIEAMTNKTASKAGYDLEGGGSLPTYLSLVKKIPSFQGKAMVAAKLAYLEVLERFI